MNEIRVNLKEIAAILFQLVCCAAAFKGILDANYMMTCAFSLFFVAFDFSGEYEGEDDDRS